MELDRTTVFSITTLYGMNKERKSFTNWVPLSIQTISSRPTVRWTSNYTRVHAYNTRI